MPKSLPYQAKKLMTLEVTWESFTGWDGYGQPRYASPVQLPCWIEASTISEEGSVALRRRDNTVVLPQFHVFFDGDDPRVRQIQLWDRFTLPNVATTETDLQALKVNTMYGPNFDNRNPWLVVVTV